MNEICSVEEFLFAYEGNDELIEKTMDMADKLMSIPDIAAILDLDADLMTLAIREGDNRFAKAYRKGKANRILAMHKAEIELAEAGSNQGVDNLHAYLNQMNVAEN